MTCCHVFITRPCNARWSGTLALSLGACFAVAAVSAVAAVAAPVYPPTPRGPAVDVYHGERVADPYRALEDSTAPATRDFIKAQNALAGPWLESLPQRAWLKSRLTQLWSYERFGVPRKAGGRYFYLRNDGRQNQSVLHVADSPTGTGRVLFDPNTQRSDATISLARFEPSPDGARLAYAVSDGGTDWEVWRFIRVADGATLADQLRFTKFWEFTWAPDGSGVWYSRYPGRAESTGARGDDQAQPVIMFHRLGEPQQADREIYRVQDHPTRVPSADVTADGRYLIVTLFDGYRTNAVDLLDLRDPAATPIRLLSAWDALYTFVGSDGDTFWFSTTKDAERGRVIAIDLQRSQSAQWREIVPQAAETLAGASWVGGRLVLQYLRDAHGVARVFERDGRFVGEVALPGLGSIGGFPRNTRDSETFFSYTDFMRPAQTLRYDAASNSVTPHRVPVIDAATDAYVTRQVFYPGKDGTRIPMFITHRRDLKKTGDTPTMLYGYGGFDISLPPAFHPSVLVWLEMGGIHASANLRGGGEYGTAWHEAGTRTRKQTVFDDFIAAAEYLVRERYTRPRRLAITGRSNGGLLVAATLLQRPDLFGAALPAVGVLDMLRYHTSSANARQWSSDYGLSEDAAEFAAQRAYSPVHNVRTGVCYPPTLVTTADVDDRVLPWHSYKFAAELQWAQGAQHRRGCSSPMLLRVETRAGHGAGKPTWMQIEDYADQWAFVAAALRMKAPG